jgi:hypothetical protein
MGLPRKALWTATAVTAVFSFEAGLAILGDTVEMKSGGTAPVYAVPGGFDNQNAGQAFSVAGASLWAWASGGATSFNYTVAGGLPGGAAANANMKNVILGTGTNKAVVYANEIFRATTAPVAIPHGKLTGASGSDNYQTVCYTVPGIISYPFSVDFKLQGGPTFFNTPQDTIAPLWFFGIKGGVGPTSLLCDGVATTTPIVGKVSGATATLSITPSTASCSITDGTQICLSYKIAGATTLLKEAGKTVTMEAVFQRITPATVVTKANPIVVAESKQSANFGLTIESDGQAFISAASGFKDFVSSDAAGAIGVNDANAYMSTTQVKIGYVTYNGNATRAVDGSAAFTIGGAGSTDTGTLVVKNGQFSASLANTAGRVFLGNITDANAVVDGTALTATWNLTGIQLGEIATKQTATPATAIPIVIRVDAASIINDTDGGDDPMGELTVKLGGTASLTDAPVTSALRRIPFDGKLCKAFNIPSPEGAADILSLRITNDSDQAGTITGTLYNEAGEQQGDNLLNLLAGHIDYTKNPPKERATLGLGDPLQLQPKETVILNSKNIATIFEKTSWAGERWVLEIQSTIPKIEVFNLLRNVENVMLQPLSNVSTSAKGVECSPIP